MKGLISNIINYLPRICNKNNLEENILFLSVHFNSNDSGDQGDNLFQNSFKLEPNFSKRNLALKSH